jgi:hypothetical protein
MNSGIMLDVYYSIRGGIDSLTGGIERSARRLADKIDWSSWQAGRPTILCLDRALFRKDLAEMRRWTDLNLVTVRATQVKKFQNPWVKPQWRRQTFLAHDLTQEARHLAPLLERFGCAFLAAAGSRHKIDGVMAANTDYWQDEALKLACRKMGIPFLVLSRESYGIGRGREYVTDVYRRAKFDFIGAGCAVASQRCEEFLSTCGSLDKALVRATGWPRYDAWLEQSLKPAAERKSLTLMSYADPQAVQYAAQNFSDVFREFVALARAYRTQHPKGDLQFVVKLKKKRDEVWLGEIDPNYASAGLVVSADMPLPELLADSRIVIGYNTLAVLEALLAETAVVVPCWSDSKRDQHRSLMHFENTLDQQVCYFPQSPVELHQLLEQAIAGTLTPKGSREKQLERFSLHSKVDPAKKASHEVEHFIRSLLPQ